MIGLTITEVLVGCPGPMVWIEKAISLLRSGSCLFVHTPSWVDVDVIKRQFEEALGNFVLEDIDPSENGSHQSVANVVRSNAFLGVEFFEYIVNRKHRQHEFEPNVIVQVIGLGAVVEELAGDWIDFIKRWTEAVAARGGDGSLPTFIFYTDETSSSWSLPKTDALAQHLTWGSCLSEDENAIALRKALSEQYRRPESTYLENVLKILCGWDINTAQLIAETTLQSDWQTLSEGIYTHLLNLTTKLGSHATFQKLLVPSVGKRHFSSEPSHLQLSAKSLVWPSRDSRIVIGPLLMALSDGGEMEVSRRIWSGLLSLIFPLLNEIRLEICRLFHDRFGSPWPNNWARLLPKDTYFDNESREFGPYDCPLSFIVRCLKEREFAEFRHIEELVRLARNLRNRLAHYDLVSFPEYSRLIDLRKDTRICSL